MDLKEFFNFILCITCMIIIIGGFFLGFIAIMEYNSCQNYSEITGKESQFKFFGGCFIKNDSNWMTHSEYEKIIIAREGLQQSKIK